MSTPPRRRLRLLRRYAAYACALCVVLLALVVGTLSQLLPVVERHPQHVAAWLSERAGHPVRFQALQAQWTRRGPLLRLQGLRVGEGSGVAIGDAEVLVAMYTGLLPGRSLTELRLRGPALTLQRGADGTWSVQGLPSAATGDPLEALRRLGELQVIGARLRVQAPALGLDESLPRIDLRVRMAGQQLRVGVRGWIDPARAPLLAVLDYDRQKGDGQAYLQAAPADLGAWAPLLHAGGIRPRHGEGELQAWAELRGNRIQSVRVVADLRRLALQGAPLAGLASVPTLAWDRLRVQGRWQVAADGWRLDLPTLQITNADKVQALDGLAIAAGGGHFAVAGDRLDASALVRGLALTDQLDPRLRRWLAQARPELGFSELQASGSRGGPLWVQGRLAELAFAPVGNTPGLEGLQGRFEGDANGVAFTFEPQATLRLDWPTGFGVVHQLQLAGQLVGWREGDGWKVQTPGLRVRERHYALDLRGGMAFQGDGSRPRIDLVAQLDDVPVPVARMFWVHSKMSKVATDWLDMALAGGTVTQGIGLASGDLDDWPFDGTDGRFEASAHIQGGQIHFQKDWPQMEQLDGDIAFIGNGFSLQGSGNLAGVAVDRIEAGIPDFRQDELYVRARSHSDAAALLAMLRRSPLQKTYGDTLSSLAVSGPASTTYDMLLPLHDNHGQGHLRGEVALDGARLADKRWDLAFDGVRGQARYSDGGFAAEDLAVLHQGRVGQLSLRAGDTVKDPRQAFEAVFAANLDAKELFDRAPQVDWLRPYFQGSSQWRVGVALPKVQPGAVQAPSKLTLDSDLVGTTMSLPSPMDKPATQALPAHVAVDLPFGDGDIDIGFGNLVAVKVATHGGTTGARVAMGSASVREPPPAHGLVVGGRTHSLDAVDWIALARSGNGDDSLPLQQIDLQVDRLQMLGGVFPDTRLRLRPAREAVAVDLAGPSLVGHLDVPNAEGAVLRGDLATVHWQPATPATDGPAQAAPSTPLAAALPAQNRQAVADFNPASIPPLALNIADLQFGKVAMGRAVLRTRRLTDGMQVDQFQLDSEKQKVAVTGAWRGQGQAATTRISARADSTDLGALMQALTFGGQLRGGEGQIQLNVGWQGAPTAFQLATLQGDVKGDVRNGQLLEVDPGAGRVLGLLSIAQLPRRLMLDFRDFFSKGLAFNRASGEIRFGDGLATTDGVRMEGPAVDIDIRGRADLRQQSFDQTVDVYPKSGNLLTVVGAVVGGPVGAAAGAAANAVLSRPLGAIGAKTYHVSGPWKDPKVEVVDREDARKDRQADRAEDAASKAEKAQSRTD